MDPERFDGAGDEFTGVPLLLPLLPVGLETRDEGVSPRVDSTFRFLAGGAFFEVVAVPFFLGNGRFFGTAGSTVASSVEGIGTEDSRSGDWCRVLFSRLSELIALDAEGSMSVTWSEGRLASTGEVGCVLLCDSCLICAGDKSPASFLVVFNGSRADGTATCGAVCSAAYALSPSSFRASESGARAEPGESCRSLIAEGRLF